MRRTALCDCSASLRARDQAAHLFADESHQRHFVARMLVRFPVMHVDDADDLPAIDQRHGKKRLVSIFLQRAERLEPGVGRSVLGPAPPPICGPPPSP